MERFKLWERSFFNPRLPLILTEALALNDEQATQWFTQVRVAGA
jgi:hypothetical protein